MNRSIPSPSQIPTGAQVLVVDDEPDNIRFLGHLLAAEGYQVHVAESGERALETLDCLADGTPPDLLLLDILMPNGMDGIEVCRRLKSRPGMAAIPVVFLTGKDDRETIVRAFEAGGSDYVLKPFDTAVLLARVRTHATLGRLTREQESALAQRTGELQQANARLQEANAGLGRLAIEISLVEEREKKRLAGELHDSPMQKLTLAQMQIASAARRRDAESDRLLEVATELMRDALAELRTLQFELSPPLLYREGLGAALRWFVAHIARRFDLELRYRESGPVLALGPDLPVILFQCAREFVFNLLKHAVATHGLVELDYGDDRVTLTVSDNGKGLAGQPESQAPGKPGGYGLFGIRERLKPWDGELAITSDAQGTRAQITAAPWPSDDAPGVSTLATDQLGGRDDT
jgi:signal transduction histidine kinase